MERAKFYLRPLNDCVLVEEEEYKPYEQYKGYTHIVTPDQFSHGPEDRNPVGKIKAKGPDCTDRIKVGDRVTFGKWDGQRFKYDGKVMTVVREYSLLGVFDEKG